MKEKRQYTKSSGNIFKDLGFPDAEEREAKAKLASKIIEIAEDKDLTQKEIASLLGIDQPKISALYRGLLSGFSITRLIKFLMLLDLNIRILIEDRKNTSNNLGHLTVTDKSKSTSSSRNKIPPSNY